MIITCSHYISSNLLHFRDHTRLIEDSIDSSIITHWDPQARWGAVAVTMAIAEILKGDRGNLISTLTGNIEQAEVRQAVDEVPRLKVIRQEPSAYVLDTLQAALWCFLTTSSFENALVAAVNLGGDTDT
ncbi:MAG: ADP-ribosylglycohydrolase family protein, partial [Candidatus Hermodarchaeota archaeon]